MTGDCCRRVLYIHAKSGISHSNAAKKRVDERHDVSDRAEIGLIETLKVLKATNISKNIAKARVFWHPSLAEAHSSTPRRAKEVPEQWWVHMVLQIAREQGAPPQTQRIQHAHGHGHGPAKFTKGKQKEERFPRHLQQLWGAVLSKYLSAAPSTPRIEVAGVADKWNRANNNIDDSNRRRTHGRKATETTAAPKRRVGKTGKQTGP